MNIVISGKEDGIWT